jgi:hypothetical protein
MMSRDEIKEILSKNVATITFTKNDGSSRDMLCTLREDVLPVTVVEDIEKKQRKQNLDVLPVWDIEKKAWRSFRIDAVEFIKIDRENN